MAEVTRFPRYHQAENVVTNHVMVMLRMLYNVSPKLLEGLLQALCAEEVTIGPRFSQQIAGAHSVPDGLILQEPLAVFVETKLGSSLDTDQLKRHCKTIADLLANRTGSFLIALTSGRSGIAVPEEVTAWAHELGIQIVPTNFDELVEQIAALPVTDLALREIIQEFTDFVYAQGLVPREDQFLVAVLTGTSWRDNLEHGVYYEPAERNPKWQRAAFLGCTMTAKSATWDALSPRSRRSRTVRGIWSSMSLRRAHLTTGNGGLFSNRSMQHMPTIPTFKPQNIAIWCFDTPAYPKRTISRTWRMQTLPAGIHPLLG